MQSSPITRVDGGFDHVCKTVRVPVLVRAQLPLEHSLHVALQRQKGDGASKRHRGQLPTRMRRFTRNQNPTLCWVYKSSKFSCSSAEPL